MIDFATAYPNSRKVYEERTARLHAGGPDVIVRVPMREVALSGGEAPVRLYDTSGPQGHDVRAGLPKLRESWIAARRASGIVGTQLYYARRGEVTPEMEFIAVSDMSDVLAAALEEASAVAVPAGLERPGAPGTQNRRMSRVQPA